MDEARIDDQEREATIDALRRAVGEGRLTLDEFGDRAGRTYGATTAEELRAVLLDLPEADLPVPAPAPTPPAPPPPVPPSERAQNVVAVFSGAKRVGRWRVRRRVNVVAVMGGALLDLYDAELTAETTTIRAYSIMGGIKILVPRGVSVEVDGFVLMGGVDNRTEPVRHPGAPMIRVVAHGFWGGVAVRHRRRDRGDDEDRRDALRAERIARRNERRDRRHRTSDAVPPLPAPPDPPTPTPAAEPATASPASVSDVPGLDGHTVTLLFTDIVDSSGLAERLGDQRWFGVLRAHNAIVREQITRHGGEEIKAQGDGFMVAFRSARRALLAAIDIQRALRSYRQGHPDMPVHARVGLHTGEVVADDGDLYGRNVILASRITSAAEPDEVLASALTKQLAEAGGDLGFGPARQVTLKGLSQEWPVHTVEWSET